MIEYLGNGMYIDRTGQRWRLDSFTLAWMQTYRWYLQQTFLYVSIPYAVYHTFEMAYSYYGRPTEHRYTYLWQLANDRFFVCRPTKTR